MRKRIMIIAAALTLCLAIILVYRDMMNQEAVGRQGGSTELTFEAEDGILNGVDIAAQSAGHSGEGYVTGFEKEDDSVAITVNAPQEGIYELWIGYNSPNGEKTTRLLLNGKPFGDVKLGATTSFSEVNAGKVFLNEGDNTIGFTSFWGWYDIDYLKIRKAESRPAHQVQNVLVNPNATEEALTLHRFLLDNYGKFILSGQQTLKDALELKWDYGKLPAVTGFDLIDYSPSRVEKRAKSLEIEDAIQWHELGGIVTFAWHWNAPADLIDSEAQPWWKGFYTESTTFDIEKTLAEPESANYQLILRDIDAIAVQLKRLQDAAIPVLWRPLHEAEGGWFWWGAKGPEPAKQLWRLLYDRLTNHHGMNNLIWIWNSEAPEWYPGTTWSISSVWTPIRRAITAPFSTGTTIGGASPR